MALSTIASWAGSAVPTIANWAGSVVVENLVGTAYSYLLNRKLPPDSEAELKRLQTALPKIIAVMGIAEALKMKHPDASQWVEQFRHALEASEDVLDELEYKKLEDIVKNQDEADRSAKKKKSLTINDETLERLKKAVTMLDQVVSGVEPLLQLATVLGIRDLSELWQEAGKVLRRETTSFLAERELFGREVEKEKIIGWLKRPTHAPLSSFGIVGLGGLGKTTLVQFAYQEMRGSNHFDKTIWICVSTKFSVEDITKKMLDELGESSCGKSLNALQETLKDKIQSRKVLLVLDDVWDDEKRRDWEQLIAPWRFVQKGSKILFTTRMKSVADLLTSVISSEHESLTLQGLEDKEIRLLFYSYAFHGSNPDNHRDLQIFIDPILKMLRGSPLAAKVIGSLLNSHMDYHHWRRILNGNSIFNLEQAKDVVEVLKLSYYHLPANLQVCFRFCSIFPQDHLFDKDKLIEMWIAVGIIPQQLCQGKQPEDIGQEYFNHLVRKSFFELVVGYKGMYVMHDLVHELAQNVSYGECCRIELNDNSITIPSTVRHVYVHDSDIDKVSHLEHLRSLVIITSEKLFVLPNNLIKKTLRLLKISGFTCCELPEEISCLVHLRYLSMSKSYSIFQSSDQSSNLASFYKLYHLNVLEFSRSYTDTAYLGIETIRIANLVKLRHMRLPKKIMQNIYGIHKLTSLQELQFFVGQEVGYRVNELGTLNNLRHLSINRTENIGDPAEAKSANLLGKNNLISLCLEWTSKSNPDNSEQVIDCLQPHPNLMELIINNYKGSRSPRWMEESPPLKLSSLKLNSCPMWKNQLFSWQMPYLKTLDILDCPNLDKLPIMSLSLMKFRVCNVGLTSLPDLYQNFDTNTPQPLLQKSSLKVVNIDKCPNLISLNGFLQQDNLNLQDIKYLTINHCKKLESVPVGVFGKLLSLEYLNIEGCQNLTTCSSLPLSLNEFNIRHSGVSALPEYYQSYDSRGGPSTSLLKSSLRKVTIINCRNLTALNGFLQQDNIDFQSFEEIEVDHCRNLVHPPIGAFGRFVSLKKLRIRHSEELTTFPSLPLSLTSFYIHAVGVSALPEYYQISDSRESPLASMLKSSLKQVYIRDCHNLTALNGFLQQDNIEFQSIEKIELLNCSNLVHPPIGGFGKFVSLKTLRIENCQKLVAVDNQSNLLPMSLTMSLKDLSIENCNLLPMSLKDLTIENCGELDVPLLKSASSLGTLTNFWIKNCANISRFPSSQNAFRSLNELSISGCKKLIEHSLTQQERGVSQGSNLVFLKLSHLEIDHLSLLLIEPLRSLRFVSYLRVFHCSGMEALPEQWLLQNSTTLKELHISGASSLKSLPTTMMRLTSLEYLRIWRADLLEQLPELPRYLRYEISRSDGQRLQKKRIPWFHEELTTQVLE